MTRLTTPEARDAEMTAVEALDALIIHTDKCGQYRADRDHCHGSECRDNYTQRINECELAIATYRRIILAALNGGA